jgi:hypothetical protein
MKKTAMLFSVLIGVVASGCDAEERPTAGADHRDAGPAAVAFNPCEGQPDRSRPEGCDGIYDCTREQCQGGACVELPSPGRSCGSNHTGTCDPSGECIPCATKCDRQYNECMQRCFGAEFEQCLCQCDRSWALCLLPCDPGGPIPTTCHL